MDVCVVTGVCVIVVELDSLFGGVFTVEVGAEVGELSAVVTSLELLGGEAEVGELLTVEAGVDGGVISVVSVVDSVVGTMTGTLVVVSATVVEAGEISGEVVGQYVSVTVTVTVAASVSVKEIVSKHQSEAAHQTYDEL